MALREPVPGQWSSRYCDCCGEPGGCGRCCYVCWCGCCAHADIAASYVPPGDEEHGKFYCAGNWRGACLYFSLPALVNAAGAMVGLGTVGSLLCGCLCCDRRGWVRAKYGVAGGKFNDCMMVWCCGPCAMCQELREIDIRRTAAALARAAPRPVDAPEAPVMVPEGAMPPSPAYPPPSPAYFPPEQAYFPPEQPFPPPQPAYQPPQY